MANDYFWSQIKKNSQQGNAPKKLSDIYSLIRENNIALYAKDIGQETQAPPPPEGTESFAVVPRDDLSKIRTLSRVRTAGPAISSLFDLAGIEPTYHGLCKKTIAGAAEDSGYEHVIDLLMLAYEKKKSGGLIRLDVGEYSAIDLATTAIRSENPALVDTGLTSFLLNLIKATPKYAPTNIGPGEFFCILFSDARAASGAGDLEIGGRKLELKASGARLGGGSDRQANHASGNIIKFLSSKKISYQTSEFFEEEKNALIEELSHTIDQLVNNQRTDIPSLMAAVQKVISSSRYHRQVVAKVYTKNLFGRLAELVDDINNPQTNSQKYFKTGTPPPTLLSPVSPDGKFSPKDNRKTTTLTLAQFLQKELQNVKESFLSRKSASKDELQDELQDKDIASERNLAYLLKNTFNAIKNTNIKDSITIQDLIYIILYTNSYNIEELRGYGYDLLQDISSYLSNKGGVDNILNMSTGAIVDLIGGLHLISYSKEAQFTEFVLMNKSTGKIFNTPAPQNLDEAIQICLRPDIKVDPVVDQITKGTIYASTAAYTLE